MKSFLHICCVMLLSVLMFSCEKDIEPSLFAPAMKTGQAVEVYRKGATLYGNIQNPAGYKVESFGIELATFSRPGMTIEQYFATAQRFVVDSADAQGNFSVQVSGLEPGGTYLYRSFVNSGHNDVYAADSTFKTPENTAPVFGNIKVTNVSYTGFDISVELLDDGGKEMETMAYLYKEMPEESQEDLTTRTPDIVTLYVNNLTEENTYTASIKNLYAGRRYAIRPYGVAFTTGYGKTQYVQTQVSDATLVSACDTSNASYNSLHLKASILAENKQYPVTEVGFCYSSESSEPTVAHLTLPATLTGTDFEATLTQLISEKTYYIRAYARQSDDAYIYGEVLEYTPSDVFYTLSFDANGGSGEMPSQMYFPEVQQEISANTFTRDGYSFAGWNTSPDGSGTAYTDQQEITLSEDLTLYAQWEQEQVVSGSENGYDYVDLGLPSGTLWATCNVGATTPEGYGDYFAWGETEPKTNYDWSTYKYCEGSSSTISKYAYGDGNLVLSDDAARVNWGGRWRMPTISELQELIDYCSWTWTSQNGVKGYRVINITNGNSIFLPATDLTLMNYSWSSSFDALNGVVPIGAYFLHKHSNRLKDYYFYKCEGLPIRAVFSDTDMPSSFVKLTFDANGGEGNMSTQIFEVSVEQSILKNRFTCEDHYFFGWNTSPDGTGTVYDNKQRITISADLTLYAQWKSTKGGFENGYEWVDLGLPSGTLWATCNVGATTPEGYGDYFAWGETESKDNYDWSSYKYANRSASYLTKYNIDSLYGIVDNKFRLDYSDDAARVNWGGKWRMPTHAEQDELRNNCTWVWTTKNGIKGFMVESKKNENSIFLPASGYSDGESSYDVGSTSCYWANSLRTERYAYNLYFRMDRVDWSSGKRCEGNPVRAVFSENDNPSTFVRLSFDTNGGEGSMPVQTFEAGVAQSILLNRFTCKDHYFLSWNTTFDGLGSSYADLQEITLTEDMTIYARWKDVSQEVSGIENGHAYVDLGLPSGIKWATCNVGATTPEDYGDYFAWGETEPKDVYQWVTYIFRTAGEGEPFIRLGKYVYYPSSDAFYYGREDGKTTLELSDDAASVNWGGDWRMPTYNELDELKNYCTWTKILYNEINGYRVTSKINGNSIFLPTAGYRNATSVDYVGSGGYYWSSSLRKVITIYAYGLYFGTKIYAQWDDDDLEMARFIGKSVRAVCP